MGHDTHFLSRLSRVSAQQTELALSLYRDTALLKEVLDRSRLPDGVERVALALEDGGAGPHLVLQRSGHFVTCLGPGMTVGDLPIISRARLDAAAAQLAVLRERLQAAQRLTGGEDGQSGKLFLRAFVAGPSLTREEFQAMLVWVPLLVEALVDIQRDLYDHVPRLRARLTQALDPTRRREVLKLLVQTIWAIGHFDALVLADGGPRAALQTHRGDGLDNWARLCLAQATLANRLPVTLRAFHGIGRLGKPLVPAFKRDVSSVARVGAEMARIALFAIAFAHPKMTHEVAKAIDRGSAELPEVIAGTLENASSLLARGRGIARILFAEDGKAVFERDEDVPDELARAVWGVVPLPTFNASGEGVESLVRVLALTVPRRVEELYLPESWARRLLRDAEEDEGEQMLRQWRATFVSHAPARRADVPARNDPCRCGSGRKFKKCCGG